jgi:hypothetical protein
VLLGQHRHPERERVHAGEHPPARPQHAGDLGDEILGRQPQRKGPVLGDHPVCAPVGEELKPAPLGRHGNQPAWTGRPGLGDRHLRLRGRIDHPQHAVAGLDGDLGRPRAGPGDVDEKLRRGRQPARELGEGDGGVKARIVGGRTGVQGGAGGMPDIWRYRLHGITPGRAPVRMAPHGS